MIIRIDTRDNGHPVRDGNQNRTTRNTYGFRFFTGAFFFSPPTLETSSSSFPSCCTLRFFFFVGVSFGSPAAAATEALAYPLPPKGELAARACLREVE
jgi:hypothetical protein